MDLGFLGHFKVAVWVNKMVYQKVFLIFLIFSRRPKTFLVSLTTLKWRLFSDVRRDPSLVGNAVHDSKASQ